MTVEEVAKRERELASLDGEIARYRGSRPSWPLWVFASSLLLSLLALRW